MLLCCSSASHFSVELSWDFCRIAQRSRSWRFSHCCTCHLCLKHNLFHGSLAFSVRADAPPTLFCCRRLLLDLFCVNPEGSSLWLSSCKHIWLESFPCNAGFSGEPEAWNDLHGQLSIKLVGLFKHKVWTWVLPGSNFDNYIRSTVLILANAAAPLSSNLN